jgi:cellulose synthase/poly-beta-1,6-N-acetylglucosamine synthase-like glycosyltransferase
VGVAGGTTRVEPGDGGFFDRLQASELISKVSVSMGSAGLGLPLTIMGNNISFLRRAYDEVGGYEAMPPRIVEDLALMNAITRGAGYRLGWAAGIEGVAASTPESRFSIFVEQRRRWLNEVSDMSWPGKLTLWVEVLMNTAFFLSIAMAFVTPLPLLIVATTWLGGYGLVLGANPGATARDFFFIPFMLIFQLYYTSVIAWRRIAGHKKVVWKGREYS